MNVAPDHAPSDTANAVDGSLEAELERRFERSIAELDARVRRRAELAPAADALRHFCAAPGKRIRPRLFLRALRVLDPAFPASDEVAEIACALEHFHNFLLIHDDVIDGGLSRRGRSTLHRFLIDERGLAAGNAEHVAIILGNVLYSHAMRAFCETSGTGSAGLALETFLDAACDTGLGECAELLRLEQPLADVGEEAVRDTYVLKTSRYTFEAPLLMAARLTGHSERLGEPLRDFARPLGVAFQIENDLHEVELGPEAARELASDMRSGIKTLFLKRAHERLDPDDRAFMDAFLASPSKSEKDVERAVRLLARSPAREEMTREIARQFQRSRQTLEARFFRPQERRGLEALLDFIAARSRHSESAEGGRQRCGGAV